MDWFNNYIKNIAYILIFVSFLGIIIPGEKYKEYIKLVTGVVVIIVVISPVAGLFNSSGGYTDILRKLELELNYGISNNPSFSYDDKNTQLIIDEYCASLKNMLFSQIGAFEYNLMESNFEISQEEKDFAAIKRMDLVLEKFDSANKSSGLIKIDKITLEPWDSQTEKNQIEDSEEIINLKKYLSSFYNLSVDNIHILCR